MSVPAHMADTESGGQKLDNVWERQQQKAFTAWCNSHLRKRSLKIENIQTDLSDGKLFLQMMEVVGDVKLPKAARGKMRIHKIQNLNGVMHYLKEKGIRLVGIGAEEICDENLKLILGTIWTIILRFDIQDISVEEMSAKDALLLWCQRKTATYNDVKVTNFHMSWKDGLAFCALIHKHRPDLLDYDSLNKGDALGNLTLALDVADRELGIAKMIDPEDVVALVKPDERSIMTQVAAFYKCFASYNKNEVAASKIANVLKMSKEHERLIQEYETMASDLLAWIPTAVGQLNERPVLGSVEACRENLTSFIPFRTEEYPSKLNEKAVLEAHYSSLQTKLRLSGRPPYVPSEGKMIEDINGSWGQVDAADAENKSWTLSELKRNKTCEQRAAIFYKKAGVHDAWATDQSELLNTDNYSMLNLGAVQAMIKRQEAFKHELSAKETAVHEIGMLANELDDLLYHGKDAVNERYASIYSNWDELQRQTAARDEALSAALAQQQQLEELWLQIATISAPLNAELDEHLDKLDEALFTDSEEEVAALVQLFQEFQTATLPEFEARYTSYAELCAQSLELVGDERSSTPEGSSRASMISNENPYAVHSQEELSEKFAKLQEAIPQRQAQLDAEGQKQAARSALCARFAEAAQVTYGNVGGLEAQVKAVDVDTTTDLEAQLETLKGVQSEVEGHAAQLAEVEALSKEMESELIFENKHSKLTIEMLRGEVQRLGTAIRSVEASVQNQILTRDSTNITDEQMGEYRTSFAHFDKDKSGELDRLEFRGCLISLGVDIPQVPEGSDDEFNRIMSRVDPNGDGHISFAEFVAFMAEELQDAETQDDLLAQFSLLANGADYIVPDQLNDLEPELKQYCLDSMPPYEGGPEGALDYQSFAAAAFGESAEI